MPHASPRYPGLGMTAPDASPRRLDRTQSAGDDDRVAGVDPSAPLAPARGALARTSSLRMEAPRRPTETAVSPRGRPAAASPAEAGKAAAAAAAAAAASYSRANWQDVFAPSTKRK